MKRRVWAVGVIRGGKFVGWRILPNASVKASEMFGSDAKH